LAPCAWSAWRFNSDTLIEFERGLGLISDKFPVWHRLGRLFPGRRSAGGRDWGLAWWLTDLGEKLLDGPGIGDEHSARLSVRYPSQTGHYRSED